MRKLNKQILIFALNFILLLPAIALAQCPTGTGPICLNLDYPSIGTGPNALDLNNNQGLNQIIGWFYSLMIAISGLAAFIMLVWAGFKWISSAGNPTEIGEAKDRITSAFLGLLIVLSSYLIVKIINPDLLILSNPIL